MDDQITVRLPTPLGRTLRRTSRRLGRRPSHVVRMALEAFLQEAPSADGKRPSGWSTSLAPCRRESPTWRSDTVSTFSRR